jgi:hypothetical protein
LVRFTPGAAGAPHSIAAKNGILFPVGGTPAIRRLRLDQGRRSPPAVALRAAIRRAMRAPGGLSPEPP